MIGEDVVPSKRGVFEHLSTDRQYLISSPDFPFKIEKTF